MNRQRARELRKGPVPFGQSAAETEAEEGAF